MPALPFCPIVVETDVPGRLRVINGVHAAAELLVGDDWPAEKRGNVGRRLRGLPCGSRRDGRDTASARAIYILASKDAGIYVREGDDEWRCFRESCPPGRGRRNHLRTGLRQQ